MVELFRNPKIDWINAKKFFIGITIFLMVLGAISVEFRGFNAGVDFTGGTLMSVAFKEQQSPGQVRRALEEAGLDTSKVTLQPITSRKNEMMIRAPQLTSGNELERRVDEDKRTIIRALKRLNPEGDTSQGKININSIDAAGIEAELRAADPLGIRGQDFSTHPYQLLGQQVAAKRDEQKYLNDMSAILGADLNLAQLPEAEQARAKFDQAVVKKFLEDRFYAGKIDVNLAGVEEIKQALIRINPLNDTSYDYAKAAASIADYRKNVSGIINNLSDVNGQPPMKTQAIAPELVSAMGQYFSEGTFAVTSADVVGAVVGADLRNRAIYVTLAALAGMLVYIAFRFEWIYGVAAVTAVFHDVMITMGFFSLFQWEISLTVIAALLTLVGYSMNDTIVIFDRIRENLRLRRRDSLVQIANDSINQTLSRTVITSGLTFVSVLAIVLFGGEVLRGFALALTIGIVIGTYSSIAVASPMMLWWEYIVSGKGRGKAVDTKSKSSERTLARV